MTYSGGSSKVFRSALNALVESICTSSMIKTLYFPSVGEYLELSMISLMLSTLLFDAASSSVTFIDAMESMLLHTAHFPHGLPSTGLSQLTAFAKSFATEVLPVPLVPQNR